MLGRIFDIQRFSLHDGNGVRTIVFFKGCLLRCKWCCNPESQNYDFETMKGFLHGAGYAKIQDKTVGRDVTVAEVMAEAEKDRPYYRRSGGGLTLSGGEALLQPDFALELLKAASESGINTAIESTAMVDFSVIEKIEPYLDQFLMDIKHINGAKHKQFTGKENNLALENAKRITTELIIRVPVIPGFNDTVQEITDIANFAASNTAAKEIHLLPYHRYGEGKYAALNRHYQMGDIKTPTEEKMQELKKAVKNIPCRIGG